MHRGAELHTHLARLAANLLYTMDASCRGAVVHPLHARHTSNASIPGKADVSEAASSFKTAPSEVDSGAAGSGQQEGLRLHMERLQAFGGVEEVARHFRSAASSEARCNMLCVLLDCSAAHSCRVGSLSLVSILKLASAGVIIHGGSAGQSICAE